MLLLPAESNKSPRTELEELHELDEEDLLGKAIAMSLEEKEEPHCLTGVLKIMNSSNFSKNQSIHPTPAPSPLPLGHCATTFGQLWHKFETNLRQL